ncbi:Pc21g05980 [Penicillium rubens Wisconsin 54-1255]|uniref:Pc21g05980 protein n=1 Tax=Penicillium rubens (strain ATCC 28089 / DSM 1075 / NRRL 1951 / Wisconsin 54-1255) TaxID=500485 RepID=B6HIF5_PENRW|nr:Pc21g05980 [Penicillium rubens Wisconsin 54-1255]
MPQDGREDKPEGFSKYLKRVKTVLRPRSISKRQSITPGRKHHHHRHRHRHQYRDQQQQQHPHQHRHQNQSQHQNQPKSLAQEKARALFAKYGLTVDTSDWKTPPDLQLTRVTKPIRMRVHRTCHRCETTFGKEKVCVNCQHTRCTKCPRHPPARNKDGEPSTRKPKDSETYVPQPYMYPRTTNLKLSTTKEVSIKMASPTGGADFVHRPVRQRVHRYCHFCASLFTPGTKECPSCSHVRCKICPRDPAKLDKYPDGYPGDADPPRPRPERTWKKPRQRVHYVCHVCETWFQGDAENCSNCGQAKCEKTKRIPPKKVKRETDPEVLKSIEEKLAAMALEPTDTAEAAA